VAPPDLEKERTRLETFETLGKVVFDPFYPRFWPERMAGQFSTRTPQGIFVCDMSDLFGIGIPEDWTWQVIDVIIKHPRHRFYLLTKQPQNLTKFSPFPDNCWVGVTATNAKMAEEAGFWLWEVKAKVKYVSFEPLLEHIPAHLEAYLSEDVEGIKWVIIGACTGTLNDLKSMLVKYPDLTLMPYGKRWTLQPKLEWVRGIAEACDEAGVKVFLKDNLRPLLIPEDCKRPNYLMDNIFWSSEKATLRQEIPEEVK